MDAARDDEARDDAARCLAASTNSACTRRPSEEELSVGSSGLEWAEAGGGGRSEGILGGRIPSVGIFGSSTGGGGGGFKLLLLPPLPTRR